MYAKIESVSYYLPDAELTNADISREFPEWSIDKIASKTGINSRHIASKDQFSSDLAISAARRLFEEHPVTAANIDFVILCTQSPDFALPTTACLVQDALGIPTSAGALDLNLGCSGYVYGLGLAKGLIESGQANNVLLLTADTYSKYLHPEDKSVKTIFGDGASASLISGKAQAPSVIGLKYGTDGSGARHLVVPEGGLRSASDLMPKSNLDSRGLSSAEYGLYMDGPEIFNFTIRVVPETLNAVLETAGIGFEDVDLFIFHQANAFMLNHLKKSLNIPDEKFYTFMSETGNTVSSTIPIALSEAMKEGRVAPGSTILILGFGVGLSWGGAVIRF